MHFVLPVVVMSDAPETRFHTAEHGFESGERVFRQLGVNNRCHRGALARYSAGGIHVVLAEAASDGVDADHGVHVAGGDAAGDIGASHGFQGFGIFPVRLCGDSDPEPLVEQIAADYRGSERRMFHIGVAGDEKNVNGIPAESFHLKAGHRQKFDVFVHDHSCWFRLRLA